jgi:hypothetical protein
MPNRTIALKMSSLPAITTTPLLLSCGAVLENVPDLAAIVAFNLNNRCTALWVAEDAFWPIACLTQLAHSFRWVFVQFSASRVQIEAITTFALATEAAHDTFGVVSNFSTIGMLIYAV